ncbi:hypothetical protein L7F22_040879 [Adiantum nelumboides]|nr:hypothetical protein [Adiantum nelumboides]
MSRPSSPRNLVSPSYEDASMHPEFSQQSPTIAHLEQIFKVLSNMMAQINTTNQHLVGYLSQKQYPQYKADPKVRPKSFAGLPTEAVLAWIDHFKNVASNHDWVRTTRHSRSARCLKDLPPHADPTMSEDMKLFFLWPRLHHDIARRVKDQGPLSFHEAIQIAQRIESNMQPEYSSTTTVNPPYNNRPLLETPTPMEIDVQNIQMAQRRRLPDRDAQGRPRCYQCNRYGHIRRPLNVVTRHDVYPLPHLDELLDQLGHSRFFTSLDLASGYWQVPLDPTDAHKTAFRTPTGLYEFKRMPFGLTDAGSTFQRMANSIFADLIQNRVLAVYLDDILVHTATWEEHLAILKEVLARIRKYNLTLQFKKCKWGATQLKFLGYLISAKGIQIDPAKVAAIQNFPQPLNVKSIQSFLGLVNCCLRFIPRLADITKPLRSLLTKNAKFMWDDECKKSFQQLKLLIQQALSLVFPDFSKPFLLQTDASNHDIAAVLLQQDADNNWLPICFINRGLTKCEYNYSTTEKELLAIVWAFQKLHPYLHGSQVTITTDHQPLISMFKKPHPPGRLLRWILALQEYSFTIKYCKGTDNTTANCLSQNPSPEFQLHTLISLTSLQHPLLIPQKSLNFNILILTSKPSFINSAQHLTLHNFSTYSS